MITLVDHPIDVAALLQAVADPDNGGTVLFLGTTRRETGEREVVELRYEAYDELALAEMSAIAAEAVEAYGARVALVHRLGVVAVGEASVAVAASAPHRPTAFAAGRYLIDQLKARVPIWKQEAFADGDATWRDGADRPDIARSLDAR